MINLLPPSSKQELAAARSNTLLVRYNILMLFVVAFLVGATLVTQFFLESTKAEKVAKVSENNAKVDGFAAVQSQAKDFRANLELDKSIISQSYPYTRLMVEIAKIMPKGTVLSDLTLDSKTFGSETIFTVQAKDNNKALSVKDAFQGSSYFSNVHLKSISNSGNGAYPVKADIALIIKKDTL